MQFLSLSNNFPFVFVVAFRMSYDDVIPLLGDFGSYQRKIYFLLCLPAILCAFHKLGNVFMIAEPNYR